MHICTLCPLVLVWQITLLYVKIITYVLTFFMLVTSKLAAAIVFPYLKCSFLYRHTECKYKHSGKPTVLKWFADFPEKKVICRCSYKTISSKVNLTFSWEKKSFSPNFSTNWHWKRSLAYLTSPKSGRKICFHPWRLWGSQYASVSWQVEQN